MGIALIALSTVGGILMAVAVGLLKDEVAAWLPRVNKWMLELAVRRLPAQHRERYNEEWSSYIEEFPGKISQLAQVLSLQFASYRLKTKLSDDKPKTLQELSREVLVEGDKTYKWLLRYISIFVILETLGLLYGPNPQNISHVIAYLFGAIILAMALAWKFWLRGIVQREAEREPSIRP